MSAPDPTVPTASARARRRVPKRWWLLVAVLAVGGLAALLLGVALLT